MVCPNVTMSGSSHILTPAKSSLTATETLDQEVSWAAFINVLPTWPLIRWEEDATGSMRLSAPQARREYSQGARPPLDLNNW